MNRRQALDEACFLLRKQAKEESLAKFLLQYLLEENSSEFNTNINNNISNSVYEKYINLINQHINNDTPLSHLVGYDYFYERKFYVTKDVLSPRMETEELVYMILDYVNKNFKNKYCKILDLCTGSGIIGITLSKELSNVDVLASDISEKALNIAQKNNEVNNANVKFIKSDLFEHINDKFDIIVSNPPYISYAEKETIEDNVLNYDPHSALFAEENGMYFYRNIIEQAEIYLNDNGIIFFEIGHNQREQIIKLAEKNEYSCAIVKDINGKDRIAILEKI